MRFTIDGKVIGTFPTQDAEVYDQGEYICVAENRVGRVDAAANIVVVPDPNNRRCALLFDVVVVVCIVVYFVVVPDPNNRRFAYIF